LQIIVISGSCSDYAEPGDQFGVLKKAGALNTNSHMIFSIHTPIGHHHLPQLRNFHPGNNINFKWGCMGNDHVTESMRVDQGVRSLSNAERPQEKGEGYVQ
jgi:hypothetical protein